MEELKREVGKLEEKKAAQFPEQMMEQSYSEPEPTLYEGDGQRDEWTSVMKATNRCLVKARYLLQVAKDRNTRLEIARRESDLKGYRSQREDSLEASAVDESFVEEQCEDEVSPSNIISTW